MIFNVVGCCGVNFTITLGPGVLTAGSRTPLGHDAAFQGGLVQRTFHFLFCR